MKRKSEELSFLSNQYSIDQYAMIYILRNKISILIERRVVIIINYRRLNDQWTRADASAHNAIEVHARKDDSMHINFSLVTLHVHFYVTILTGEMLQYVNRRFGSFRENFPRCFVVIARDKGDLAKINERK